MAKFDHLSGLAELVARNKVKNIHVIGNPDAAPTKLERLYRGLCSNQWESEESAAQELNYKNAQSPAFQKLKTRLHDRLLNTLLFIDINQPNFTELQRAYYSCYKNVAAVKILLGRSSRSYAMPIAEKTLKTALSFEFTEIALTLAKDLRSHYSNIIGDSKKAASFNTIVKTQTNLYLAEIRADEYYSDLITNYVNSKATKPEIAKVAKDYSIKLRELLGENNSFRLNFVSYSVFILQYEILNDYRGTLKICQEAIQYFERKKQPPPSVVFWNFSLKMLLCYIQLKQYQLGEKTSDKCLSLQPIGSNNWFGSLNYSIILYFHSEQINRAFSCFITAITNKNYSKLPNPLIEPWRIHEAFIFYFIRTGKIENADSKNLKSFRINKFLNEVPTYSKDKYGTNITILILHVLFLLLDGRYGEIIDRMESLKTYTHRYLRKDHTFRSNCFIKMLLQLPAASFHKEGVIRKAKKYKDKLESVPLEKANQSVEIEIVPYEMLWEFVLDSLDNKFHHTNKKK